ncbi:type VII secretion protein EsaA [Ligilactobacillus salitolerans]|uniref:type VII secretion protein EsaA n=1 Tax=Ligilactobacillus salitolerans TaxID=1808352 RepID=UPI000F60F4A9|nr:type VII secretion protein EsaA [Ligilactobacillus salitolerans]
MQEVLFWSPFWLFLGFKDNNVVHTTNTAKSHSDYVLVNEDNGDEFNGKRYQLGNDFVTLINQDSKNNWETASRNVANAGVKSGQYDAEIIIPQDFSQRLLALQSTAPKKALVSYHVRDSQNAISNEQVENKVNGILNDFNHRIVQMYFSNIVGNLAEAQHNVNNMVGAEETRQTSLTSAYTPAKELTADLSGVMEVSSILAENNQDFSAGQNAFVDEISSILKSSQEGLSDGGKSAGDAQQQVSDNNQENDAKIDKALALFGKQYDKQKEQLLEQAETDNRGYKGQYGDFYNVSRVQLFKFSDPNNENSVLANYLASSAQFQETQKKRTEQIQVEINQLSAQKDSMRQLRSELSRRFFPENNEAGNFDPATANDDQVREAIYNQLVADNGDNRVNNHLDQGYLNSIASIGYLNQDDFNSLLEKLEDKKQLSTDEANDLQNAYTVVAKANPAGAGKNHLNLIDDVKKLDKKPTSVPVTIPLDVDKLLGAGQTLTFHGDTINVDLTGAASAIEAKLNRKLNQYNATAKASVSGNEIQIKVDQAPAEETDKKESSTEANKDADKDADKEAKDSQQDEAAAENKLPSGLELNAQVNVLLTLKDPEADNNLETQDYSWTMDGSEINKGGLTTYIIDQDAPNQNLQQLFPEFANLKANAQQVVALYADPKDQNLADFAAKIKDNSDQDLTALASQDSVYWMYGNTKPADVKADIPQKALDNYRNSASKLYHDADRQASRLETTIGNPSDQPLGTENGQQLTLYGTMNLFTLPEQYQDQFEQLAAWYNDANDAIYKAGHKWKQVAQVAPESILEQGEEFPEKTDHNATADQVGDLAQTMQELAASTRESADATVKGAAQVKDDQPQIKELTAATNKVQKKVTTVTTTMGDTVAKSQKNTAANSAYAKRFGQVMANAKNGGADNPVVFDFLANPISAKGQLGAVKAISLVPYYATLIAALLILVFALSVREFMRKRQLTAEDNLVEPHRWWSNVPNVIMITLSAAVVSLIFAGVITHFAAGNKAMLFIYSLLVALGGTLLMTGVIRQFKKTALIVYGSILGLFFILTPLLGVVTKPGSLANLLYRFSPFQNIQNGYTALIGNGTLGAITMAMLILVVVLGVALNFFVKPGKDETPVTEDDPSKE